MLAWAVLTIAPLAIFQGGAVALATVLQMMLSDYVSFILLLFALYTVAGGILVSGSIRTGPWTNVGIVALGTVTASFVGTTGASLILVRPLIRANERRRHNVHVIVFFILLAGNIGGALTPLGDPPLFVGFLHGVDFWWPAQNLWLQTAIVSALVLAVFLIVDLWLFRTETTPAQAPSEPLRLRGLINFILFGAIVAAILSSATWKPGIAFHAYTVDVELQNVSRDAALVLISIIAGADTRRAPCRQRLYLGADPRGRHSVRRNLHRHRAGHGHAAGGAGRRVCVPLDCRHRARRRPARGRLFLAHGLTIRIPRQYADLLGFL
jgi:Na+/H+ antiporter NhaD/arsenite permease-like protein